MRKIKKFDAEKILIMIGNELASDRTEESETKNLHKLSKKREPGDSALQTDVTSAELTLTAL